MLPWIWLILAILFEVAGTFCLKLSDGLGKWLPSTLTFIFYFICIWALGLALKSIDVSIAYAIWAGVGTILIGAFGIFYFGEPLTPLKVVSLLLVIAGIVGLNLCGGVH